MTITALSFLPDTGFPSALAAEDGYVTYLWPMKYKAESAGGFFKKIQRMKSLLALLPTCEVMLLGAAASKAIRHPP